MKQAPGVVILPSDAREYLRTFEQLPLPERNAVLPKVLAAALKRFGATGNVQDASQTVHNTCESEHNRLDAELALLRFSVWVAPALGFVGTVRGIGLALQGAELAVRRPRPPLLDLGQSALRPAIYSGEQADEEVDRERS